jgi:hypothetical protein
MSLEGRRNSLRALPHPNALPGNPWNLCSTKQAAALLGVDPACLTVWRYRGLGPRPEARYFKGSVQVYRLDRVQSWLAQRQSLTYDANAAFRFDAHSGLKSVLARSPKSAKTGPTQRGSD